jgi:hypothetical protein
MTTGARDATRLELQVSFSFLLLFSINDQDYLLVGYMYDNNNITTTTTRHLFRAATRLKGPKRRERPPHPNDPRCNEDKEQ